MTTPTQAQIEAELAKYRDWAKDDSGDTVFRINQMQMAFDEIDRLKEKIDSLHHREANAPTQAQIEAVEAVLAQSGDTTARTFIDCLAEQGFHITAAAQVGEPVGEDDISADWKRGYETAMKSAAETYRNQLAATIERCAQWLEEDGNHATANAMRVALKDTP